MKKSVYALLLFASLFAASPGHARFTPTPVWTYTFTHTATFTTIVSVTATLTATPTPTFTKTSTPTYTVTTTGTPTFTATKTSTGTPTFTSTITNTFTLTFTQSQTFTITKTATPTFTVTLTATPTATSTVTVTSTNTPVPVNPVVQQVDIIRASGTPLQTPGQITVNGAVLDTIKTLLSAPTNLSSVTASGSTSWTNTPCSCTARPCNITIFNQSPTEVMAWWLDNLISNPAYSGISITPGVSQNPVVIDVVPGNVFHHRFSAATGNGFYQERYNTTP